MALTGAELALILKARDEATAVLAKVNKELGVSEQQLGKVARVSQAAKVAMGAFAGLMGSVVVGALSDAARAAAEEDAGIARLQTAVENAGLAFADFNATIEDKIAAQQKSLAFGDGPQRDSIAALVAITKDVNKAFELQGLAMDLARGKNIDLATATDIVGKVHAGNLGTLSRYGIVLKEGATATEALAELQARFGGQAETFGNTTAGSIEKVRLQIGDWQEDIGRALGPTQGFIAMLPGISAGMSGASTAIAGLLPMLRLLSVSMLHTVIPAIAATVIALLPIILIIGAIALAIATLAFAWSNNWGDIRGKTQAVVDFVMGLFRIFEQEGLGGLLRRILELGPAIMQGLTDGLRGLGRILIDLVLGALGGMVDAAKNFLGIRSASTVFAKIGSDTAEGFGVGFRDAWSVAVTDVEQAMINFADRANRAGRDRWYLEGKVAGAAFAKGIADAAPLIAPAVTDVLRVSTGRSFSDAQIRGILGIPSDVTATFRDIFLGLLPALEKAGTVPKPLPGLQAGGVVKETGLAVVHAGERVLPAGRGGDVHVHFHGPVFGLLDFEREVKRITRDAVLGGGFRGVLEPAR